MTKLMKLIIIINSQKNIFLKRINKDRFSALKESTKSDSVPGSMSFVTY